MDVCTYVCMYKSAQMQSDLLLVGSDPPTHRNSHPDAPRIEIFQFADKYLPQKKNVFLDTSGSSI